MRSDFRFAKKKSAAAARPISVGQFEIGTGETAAPTEVTSWNEDDKPLAWPPPDTATLFVTDASPLLFTVVFRVITADPEAAMAVVEVQVTTCPAGLQVQPEPDALTYVRFASKVSVTVTVPVVAAFPELATTIE